MSDNEPARTAGRRRRPSSIAALVALLVVSAAVIGVLLLRPLAPSTSSGASPAVDTAAIDTPSAATGPQRPTDAHDDRHGAPGDRGRADGATPDGTTVLDEEDPGVANLDPELLQALREAAGDAEEDGVRIHVNSGWRSPEYQNQLLRDAVAKYGSEEEAARWVATADTSAHVSGDAVDIGQADARAWLSEHGAEYGLCQIYSNEPWHFELRPEAIEHGCPAMYADPTHDPRMQQ